MKTKKKNENRKEKEGKQEKKPRKLKPNENGPAQLRGRLASLAGDCRGITSAMPLCEGLGFLWNIIA